MGAVMGATEDHRRPSVVSPSVMGRRHWPAALAGIASSIDTPHIISY